MSGPVENGQGRGGSSEGESSLRRGNINFDVLEPETPADERPAPTDRSGKTEELPSKRGIFDTDRKSSAIRPHHVLLWVTIFSVSLLSLVAILTTASSVIWMLALPVVLLSLVWSAIMLGLYKARPR